MSNNMKLVHWPVMDGLLHLVQRGGAGPSAGALLCGFNVPISGLTGLVCSCKMQSVYSRSKR